MGIDYAIELACEPRRTLGTRGIIHLYKGRDRAAWVLQNARKNGDQRPVAELTFQAVMRTPDGDKVTEMRLQDLFDQARPLDEQRAHCRGCPLDPGGEGYGCTGYIPYPLPAAAEDWLLDRLPGSLGSTAGQFLRRALGDFDWNGAHAAKMRSQGDTFFARDEANGIRWGKADDAPAIDSDQVFHLLFHVGAITPTHATMVALFFGVVPHDLEPGALASAERRREALEAAQIDPPPPEGAEAIAAFLLAVARAGALEAEVFIDA